MNRTVTVQLITNNEQQALHQTIEQHTECFNFVARLGFETKCSNSVDLHKKTYYPLRTLFPNLPAQLVCAARVKAAESVKSALTWQKKQNAKLMKKGKKSIRRFKPVKVPQSKYAPIRYDQRSYWVDWKTHTVSIATVAGRIKFNFTVPNYFRKYIGYKTASADLCFRNGHFYMHIVVSIPAPVVQQSLEVVGVDLGLNHPAVTSNRTFLGERQWKEQERRQFRLIRKLQAKGTRSAKRHLQKVRGKRFRQRRDHDHVLSKRIIEHSKPGSTIVFEELTNIRDNVRHKKGSGQRALHGWAFAQLYDYARYKAEAFGIKVVKVNPRHTSQICSRCKHQERGNRKSQSLFLCKECGYSLNADLNASYNIRDRHKSSLADFGIPLVGGPPSQGLSFQPFRG